MMSTRRAVFLTSIVAASLVLADAAAHSTFAQAAVATLTGRVADPQNAATPRATLLLRNQDTASTWTAITDPEGRFTIPMLPPGTYSARVDLPGFSPWQAEGLTLQTGQTRHLDVRLSIGGLQDAVTVQDVTRAVAENWRTTKPSQPPARIEA